MFDLTGHAALVTGAGQGIGAGVAVTLARHGARVVVNDLNEERAHRTAQSIADVGGDAIPLAFDVTDGDAVAAGVARARAALSQPIDILVNNAGVPTDMAIGSFRDMDPASWSRYVDLNLYGSLHCIRAVIDDMADDGWGRIVQISSAAGQSGIKLGISIYGASKSAIEGFLRHLSQEVAADGVTVNAIALGLMSNAIPEGSGSDDILRRLARSIPVGRLGTPDDVGAAVVFVASEEASWLTGQTIHLDGGQTTS